MVSIIRLLSIKSTNANSSSGTNISLNEMKVTHIDVSEFYDYVDPKSYLNKFAYSILDSLINSDDSLMRQLRTRCYRYPDCEYSSDCEEYLNTFESSPYLVKLDPKEKDEESFADFEESYLLGKTNSDHHQHHQYSGSPRANRSGATAETGPTAGSSFHPNLYLNSYYITEVSFTENV